MDFELTEEQEILSRSAESFARQSPVTRFRKVREARGDWSLETWQKMAELGWLALPFGEDVGGLGGSIFEASLIVEKLALTLVPEPYVPSVILGGISLARAGDEEQRKRFITPMTEGRTSLALACTEPGSRYDLSAVATRAERAAEGYVLDGRKIFALNGHRADHFVVTARDAAGFVMFVVDRATPGLELTPIQTIDGLGAANLQLRNVVVPADRRLTHGSIEAVTTAVDQAAALAAAEGVGLCQAMLDLTVEYLKTREQFGVKIGTFQVLQHRAVDMFVELELLRSISLEACVRADGTDQVASRAAISAAKVQLARAGKVVSQEAIQLHGGIGITDEHDIGLYFKRMTALLALHGDEESHARRYSSLPGWA
ncbi:MAG: acyl-CoA dehydrogenase family protein [Deltaproteobacteria bacterium]|nr:acyl-CoA dehydrogenase family protein [Deltaproteobacteria bacterium]